MSAAGTITKEVLVYANIPYKKFRWVTYTAICQMGFVVINLFLMPTGKLVREHHEAIKSRVIKNESNEADEYGLRQEYIPNPNRDTTTLGERFRRVKFRDLFTWGNIKENILERPYTSFGLVLASSLITAAFTLYARRTIHTITLLPNGKARFALFSPIGIGKPQTLEVPLTQISCIQPRKSPNNYSILKLRGHWFFYLVHKSDGQFLDPKAYDAHLGFRRNWA